MASAGPQAELAPLVAKLREEGVFVRELSTLGIAYHSPALDPFCGRLRTRAPFQNQQGSLHCEQRSPAVQARSNTFATDPACRQMEVKCCL